MLALLLLVSLSASPRELKLATPGLSLTGLPAKMTQPYTDHLAQQLAPVRVVTPRDMAAVLGLERQKQLLGCTDASCMAEFGNALGVDGILVGDLIAQGKKAVQVNLRVLESSGGKVLASYAEKVPGTDGVIDALTRAAARLREQLATAFPPEAEVKPAPAAAVSTTPVEVGRRFTVAPWVAGALGLVAAGVGGTFAGLAYDLRGKMLTAQPGTFSEPGSVVAARGRTYELLGGVMLPVGAALLLVAVVLGLLPGASS